VNPTVLATTLRFSEGPVWFSDEQSIEHGFARSAGLFFSDIDASNQYFLCNGVLRVVRADSCAANGNALSVDGALLSCEHRSRRVVRIDPSREPVTLVDNFEGARLNSPNDLCAIGANAIIFTDPPYGVAQEDRELMFSGVYRFNFDGNLDLLDDRLVKPNGVAVGPDDSSIWVSDTETGHIWRYELSVAGLVSRRELVLDAAGHLLAATADGITVLNVTTGQLSHIPCPQRPANLCFGGPDRDQLYVCARTDIYVFNWPSPGLAMLGSHQTAHPKG
jgi:gluconolactonase